MTVLERPLTRVEAAEQLGISLSLLDKLTATGQLIPTKIGRRTVYQQQHLRAYLESQAQPREAKTVSHPDEQQIAALTVLRAVEHRMQGEADAMVRTLRGTGRQVSVRLLEATEIIAHLLKHSDRPEQALAALLQSVRPTD